MGEKVLEVVKVALVQCNLVDNQYQQKSEVLYIFTPNKFYVYLLNVEPSNLVFLKTYNREFDEIIITFMDQNGGPLELEDKINFTLLINKQKWHNILQNHKQENMLEDMDFYHLQKNIKNKYYIKDQMLPKKVVHEAGEFIGNKIADAVTKTNDDNIEK